jgi:hypothetical protein
VQRTAILLVSGVLAAIALLPARAGAAETFLLTCKVCTKVDVVGKGLEPNARLALVIRDVRTGQTVIPNPSYVATDAKGAFSTSYDVDLSKHPSLQGNLFNSDGSDLVLAAHNRFTAPAQCGRVASLPITGAGDARLLLLPAGASLVALGVTLLLWAGPRRRRVRTAGP